MLHFTYTLKAYTQCVVYIGYAAVSTAENTKMKKGESMEFRHEVKHEINNFDLLTLRRRLQTVAYPDPHAVYGNYLIRSLYFDDLSDRALREKINGAARREKFRIRYYNGDTSVIRLEKKTKINDLGSKQSAPLTAEQAQATVDGDIGWMAGSGYLLIRELYSKMRTWGLSPKTKVDYTREPFIYPAGNVRVTLDYDIRSGTYEEYLKGVEAIKSSCSLRAESVRGQLDGSIPSTSDGQQADSSALIDASGLTISDMGSMNGGNGGFGGFGRKTRGTSSDSGATGEQTADSSDVVSGNMSVSFDPSQISGDGSMPEGMTPTDTSAETTKASEQPGEASSSGDTTKPAQSDSSGTQTGGRPQMNVFPSMSGGGGEDTNEYVLLGVSVLCLVVGIVAAAVYKRR